ncbi:MAG: hypothetical protein D6820_06735, partial [Lentisphaerae bacterium]
TGLIDSPVEHAHITLLSSNTSYPYADSLFVLSEDGQLVEGWKNNPAAAADLRGQGLQAMLSLWALQTVQTPAMVRHFSQLLGKVHLFASGLEQLGIETGAGDNPQTFILTFRHPTRDLPSEEIPLRYTLLGSPGGESLAVCNCLSSAFMGFERPEMEKVAQLLYRVSQETEGADPELLEDVRALLQEKLKN